MKLTLGKELISQELNNTPEENKLKRKNSILKDSSFLPASNSMFQQAIPENIARTFNKTLSYFRASHDSPLKKLSETPPKKTDDKIEMKLEEEKEKFNRLKLQKQVII